MKIHPAALTYPEMTADSFAELKADIKAHGQQMPVIVYESQIIDGRNRWKACEELGIKCVTEEWKRKGDESILDYVNSLNGPRRHLTASQRAATAAAQVPLYEAEAQARQKSTQLNGNLISPLKSRSVQNCPDRSDENKRSAVQAAKATGASSSYTKDAIEIKKKSPEVFEKVKEGKLSIPEAKKQLATKVIIAKLAPKVATAIEPESDEDFIVSAYEAHKVVRDLRNDFQAVLDKFLAIDPLIRIHCSEQYLISEVKSLRFAINASAPYGMCPYCGGDDSASCRACQGYRWVTETIFKNAPKDFQEGKAVRK